MFLEIEKMKTLQETLSEKDAKEVSGIIATLSHDFETIVQDSRRYILTGERVIRPLDESMKGLMKLKEIGALHGIDFPEIKTQEETSAFVLKFGKEMMGK